MSNSLLLTTSNLVKRYGGLVATRSVSLEIVEGEFHAIIGPNGAGKTTLVSQLAGELQPSEGRIFFRGADVTGLDAVSRCRLGLVRSFQITSICRDLSVVENVVLAVLGRKRHAFRFFRPVASITSVIDEAKAAIVEAGLGHCMETDAGRLAHGEQRQLEIAIAVAAKPRLLILDEPMAGMGREDSFAMISLLKKLKGKITILLIEHDMDAVFSLADRISVLVYGEKIMTGSPQDVRINPQVQSAYLGEDDHEHA